MSHQGLLTHSNEGQCFEIARPSGQASSGEQEASVDQLLTKHGVELKSLLEKTPWHRGSLH